MATPKGMRAAQFPVNGSDVIHVYSDENHIWLQLRRDGRDGPLHDGRTAQDIGRTSFKVALCMQPGTALKLGLELMSIAERTKERRKLTATLAKTSKGKA